MAGTHWPRLFCVATPFFLHGLGVRTSLYLNSGIYKRCPAPALARWVVLILQGFTKKVTDDLSALAIVLGARANTPTHVCRVKERCVLALSSFMVTTVSMIPHDVLVNVRTILVRTLPVPLPVFQEVEQGVIRKTLRRRF